MAKVSILTALSIILLGFGVPVVSIYFSVYHEFNIIIATIIAVLSLIIAGILAVLGLILILTGEEAQTLETIKPSERERLHLLRAHQRATLEELDDIVDVLEEIKNLLKTPQE